MSATTQYLASVWRYPIKSMMGEELNAVEITQKGLLGDRGYALQDIETDKIISAKNPKKWPDIFYFHARYVEPPIAGEELPPTWITLSDGSMVRSDHKTAEHQLSTALKRQVSLKRQAPHRASLEQYWPEHEGENSEISDEAIAADAANGSFFDYATVHILTTATLNRLQQLYPAGRLESRRFRPNLIIATDPSQTGFVENDWVGKTLTIGTVKLLVTDPCPRCIMPTLAQGDLEKDPHIMRTITENTVHVPFAGKSLPSAGVYARVIQTGLIQRGSPVIIE